MQTFQGVHVLLQSRANPLNLYDFFDKAVFCRFEYFINHIFINVLFILYIYINKTLLSRHIVIAPKKPRGVRVQCALGYQPPLKTPPLFLAKLPLKSSNCPSPPFRQSPPPLYCFFVNSLPPLKIGFFSEPQKC